MTTSPAFQRAPSPAHTAERRQAILTATAQLGARDGARPITLTDRARCSTWSPDSRVPHR